MGVQVPPRTLTDQVSDLVFCHSRVLRWVPGAHQERTEPRSEVGDYGLDPAEEAVGWRHISGRSVASWRRQIRPDADRNLQCGQRRPEPRARRWFQADGGGRRARVARWLGQGHGLRPATPGPRPDAAAADGGGGRRRVPPPDRGPLSWP